MLNRSGLVGIAFLSFLSGCRVEEAGVGQRTGEHEPGDLDLVGVSRSAGRARTPLRWRGGYA